MSSEKNIFQGLATDPIPDRLGNQAFYNKNVVPRSPTTIAPKFGTEKIQNYRPLNSGRNLLPDALYQDTGNAIALIWVTSTDSGGTVTDTITRIDRFAPDRIASDYASVTGINVSQIIYGIVL